MGEEAAVYDGPEEQLDVVEPVEPVAPESVEDESPPEPEAKKIEPFTPAQQAKFNEEIKEKVDQREEARRKAHEAEQRLAEAERRLKQYEAPVRPDIPPPPDPYEDDFAAKVAHRDAMIAKAAQYDGQIAWAQQQEQAARQRAEEAERERVKGIVSSYSETANKLGITAEELQTAGAQIAPFVPDRLAMRILNDPQGPEITTWLARNIAEADKMARMSPEDAAVHLELVVKPKAKRAPPKLAPEPSDRLTGASMKEGGRGPKGVVYE